MRKTMSLATVALLVAGLTAAGAAAQGSSFKIPFVQVDFVPCANGGAGEEVLIEGVLNVVDHVRIDANGGFHGKLHFQPQGATGVGLTTGDVYRATGVSQESFNVSGRGLPLTDTYINNFRLIGPGRDNNFLLHETIHVTIDAHGVVTAVVDHFTVACR